jgi:outer membrane lipoprotein-sorting protein
MSISRRALLGCAALLLSPGLAWPEDADAPLDLQTAKRVKPAKERPAPNLTTDEIVAKANDFLNATRFMSADFVQIGPDGKRTEGLLVLQRPGKMLFRYKPPAKLEIVADGRSVAVRDQKLGTQDLYLIGQTPLKFLLADHIDLAKDTKLKRVEIDGRAATIEIEDKATFGGKSDITLVFDPDTFELKQWTVIDPQGFRTLVSLFALDLVTKPDPQWFYVDDSVQPNLTRTR